MASTPFVADSIDYSGALGEDGQDRTLTDEGAQEIDSAAQAERLRHGGADRIP
jgi:hypothetical protein